MIVPDKTCTAVKRSHAFWLFVLRVVKTDDYLCHFRVPVLTSWPVKDLTSTRCSVMVSASKSDSVILFWSVLNLNILVYSIT